MIQQVEITLSPKSRGFHLVTSEVMRQLPKLPKTGIINIFCKHTSCGLSINENADPDVRVDMETIFNRLVPENRPEYEHTLEGADDMPAPKLVADLMVSKHGAYIAKLWEHDGKRPKIKANLIGTLVGAGVLTTNKSAIARTFLGISDKTRDEDEKREVNTFGTYIGRWKKEPYADWVKDYVSKSS